MDAPLTRLEFRLGDEVEGRPMTPETVDLPTLRGFLEEVEKLIKGDVPGASLAESRVRIEEGSVKVVAMVAALLAASLDRDLMALAQTSDLDVVQPRRGDVLAVWQSRARKTRTRSYLVQAVADSVPPLQISAQTDLQRRGENSWVAVEKYVTGKVIDMGGKQSPNVHVLLEGIDQALTISATEPQLAGEPHLYQQVTLRVAAEQHLDTKQLRNAHLLEFLPTSQVADEGALALLWEKGRIAWQGVASATAWTEELRGH